MTIIAERAKSAETFNILGAFASFTTVIAERANRAESLEVIS